LPTGNRCIYGEHNQDFREKADLSQRLLVFWFLTETIAVKFNLRRRRKIQIDFIFQFTDPVVPGIPSAIIKQGLAEDIKFY